MNIATIQHPLVAQLEEELLPLLREALPFLVAQAYAPNATV